MMRKLVSLFAIISLSLGVYAQSLESVDWGAFNDMPEETSYQQAIGFDSDAFFFIRSDHKVGLNREKVWLEGYSSLTNTFESSNEIILPSVSGVQTEYETMYYKDNKFILFTSARNRNRNQIVLYVSYLKPDGTLKNKPKEIAALPLSNLPKDGFNFFLSDDEKNIVVESHKTFKKYNSDKLNLVVLDFNLAEVFKSSVVLDDKYDNKELIIIQKSFNDGKFIFLAKSELINTRRSSKSTSYDFVTFVYNTANKSIHPFTVKILKYKIADARYTINKKGNIVVGGFFAGKTKKFVNEKIGMFFKQYNPKTLKLIPDVDLKSYFLKFSREFLVEINNPLYGETKDIRSAYGVKSIEELANGGYIILSEQKWVDGRTVVEANKKEATGIEYFHYNNILAGGINKKGRFTWTKIFPKVQLSTNDHGYFSSYKVIPVMNKLKLFYNDNESNLHSGKIKKLKEFKNNVRSKPSGMAGVLTIYMDGSFERDPMFTGKAKDVVFIPHTLGQNSIGYGFGVTDGKEVKFGSFIIE